MERSLVERTMNSVEFFLNPELVENDDPVRRVGDHLANGDLIVIRNAFQPGFAERMFGCLDQFSNWKVYEGYEDHFHYHHHNIYDDNLFPADLAWCRDIFRSDPTKEFMGRLSQRDCAGKTTFSASLYLPGDHSLPHNDYLGDIECHRQVAFVWQLTKNWRSDWGGEFFWCRKDRWISPEFNTLLLFRVQPSSTHFVTQVTAHARGKRMAVSGWWTGKMEPQLETHADKQVAAELPLVEII